MRLFIPIVLMMVFLLSGCQSQQDELKMSDESLHLNLIDQNPVQISKDVNSVEVGNIVKSVFGKQVKSRSNTGYRATVYKDKDGQDRVIAVNFEDNKGFILLSAVKTYKPILAYSEEGSFTLDKNDDSPLNTWWNYTFDDIVSSKELPADSLRKISAIWRNFEKREEKVKSRNYGDEPDHSRLKYLTDEQYQRFSRKIMDQMAVWSEKKYQYWPIDNYPGTCDLGDQNAMGNFVQGIINPDYAEDYWAFTFVVEIEHDVKKGKGSTMQTKWSQRNGYNQCFPYKGDGTDERQPVGCGPIAVGQIMYYYKYPETFDWDHMTLEGTGNKTTSLFLLDVHDKCNARYYPIEDATGCNHGERVQALKAYGYTLEDVGPEGITHNNLLYKSPAEISSTLFRSADDKKGIGHSWIVDGGIYRESGAEVEIWTITYSEDFERVHLDTSGVYSQYTFFVNWGGGSAPNAYYSLDSMIPTSGYQRSKFKNGILNIKPKNN